jgi:hypothetical protein
MTARECSLDFGRCLAKDFMLGSSPRSALRRTLRRLEVAVAADDKRSRVRECA